MAKIASRDDRCRRTLLDSEQGITGQKDAITTPIPKRVGDHKILESIRLFSAALGLLEHDYQNSDESLGQKTR